MNAPHRNRSRICHSQFDATRRVKSTTREIFPGSDIVSPVTTRLADRIGGVSARDTP